MFKWASRGHPAVQPIATAHQQDITAGLDPSFHVMATFTVKQGAHGRGAFGGGITMTHQQGVGAEQQAWMA